MNENNKTDVEISIECLDMYMAIHSTFYDIVKDRLNKYGLSEVTPTIIYYVYKLGQNPHMMSITEFSQKSMLVTKNMTYALGILERNGYLQSEIHSIDRRTRLIGLTDKGTTLFNAINVVLNDLLTQTDYDSASMEKKHEALTKELEMLKRYYINI